MATPLEQILNGLDWEPTGHAVEGDIPVATHESVLQIPGGQLLRVYQLSNGMRIIDADDMHKFFEIIAETLTTEV